jgi:hypothetical protein
MGRQARTKFVSRIVFDAGTPNEHFYDCDSKGYPLAKFERSMRRPPVKHGAQEHGQEPLDRMFGDAVRFDFDDLFLRDDYLPNPASREDAGLDWCFSTTQSSDWSMG